MPSTPAGSNTPAGEAFCQPAGSDSDSANKDWPEGVQIGAGRFLGASSAARCGVVTVYVCLAVFVFLWIWLEVARDAHFVFADAATCGTVNVKGDSCLVDVPFANSDLEGATFSEADKNDLSRSHLCLSERAAKDAESASGKRYGFLFCRDGADRVIRHLEHNITGGALFGQLVLALVVSVTVVGVFVLVLSCCPLSAMVGMTGANIVFGVAMGIGIMVKFSGGLAGRLCGIGILVLTFLYGGATHMKMDELRHSSNIICSAVRGVKSNSRCLLFTSCVQALEVGVVFVFLRSAALVGRTYKAEGNPLTLFVLWIGAMFTVHLVVIQFLRNVVLTTVTLSVGGWYFNEPGQAGYPLQAFKWSLWSLASGTLTCAFVGRICEYKLELAGSTNTQVMLRLIVDPLSTPLAYLAKACTDWPLSWTRWAFMARACTGKRLEESGPASIYMMRRHLGDNCFSLVIRDVLFNTLAPLAFFLNLAFVITNSGDGIDPMTLLLYGWPLFYPRLATLCCGWICAVHCVTTNAHLKFLPGLVATQVFEMAIDTVSAAVDSCQLFYVIERENANAQERHSVMYEALSKPRGGSVTSISDMIDEDEAAMYNVELIDRGTAAGSVNLRQREPKQTLDPPATRGSLISSGGTIGSLDEASDMTMPATPKGFGMTVPPAPSESGMMVPPVPNDPGMT